MVSSLATVHLERGNLITMRKHDGLHLLKKNFRPFEKFKPPGCDTTWNGKCNVTITDVPPIVGVYCVTHRLRLLNLGNKETLTTALEDNDETQTSPSFYSRLSIHPKYRSYNGTIATSAINVNPPTEEIIIFNNKYRTHGLSLKLISISI